MKKGTAEQLSNARQLGLLDGYRAMVLDREQEAEAQEWCEGLIGDATDQDARTGQA